jgi:hypothetical protein
MSWRRDGVEQPRRDAGPCHDDLDQAGAADERREQRADAGDERDDGRPQGVLVGDAAVPSPLARAVRMKSAPEVLDHLPAQNPGEAGDPCRCDHEPGHDHVPHDVPELVPGRERLPAVAGHAGDWEHELRVAERSRG